MWKKDRVDVNIQYNVSKINQYNDHEQPTLLRMNSRSSSKNKRQNTVNGGSVTSERARQRRFNHLKIDLNKTKKIKKKAIDLQPFNNLSELELGQDDKLREKVDKKNKMKLDELKKKLRKTKKKLTVK
mmetsp:Transcript_11500/g.10168  ORF Transcript_11500/g.10168 Transcript_11500/m.10168 type:complete len:128 (+) Transcript_11500:240-623(+)